MTLTVESKMLGSVLLLFALSVATNQTPIESFNNEVIRPERQFFNDFDGGIFYGGNYLDAQNTEAIQERQLKWISSYKPRRIKTDPDFDRRLSQLQQKFSFSPFLQAYAKYFVRNREQKRERRNVDNGNYYENRKNRIYDDYYEQEEYEEKPHHFHPIPVF